VWSLRLGRGWRLDENVLANRNGLERDAHVCVWLGEDWELDALFDVQSSHDRHELEWVCMRFVFFTCLTC
jgi:hypothetical protein